MGERRAAAPPINAYAARCVWLMVAAASSASMNCRIERFIGFYSFR
jgi:hypothetical protein